MAAGVDQTLVLNGLAGIAAILYLIAGRTIARRQVSEENRGALRGFVMWWYGLAFLAVFGIATDRGFNAAHFGLGTALVTLYALLVLIFVILAGLVYYLLFLYTGQHAWLPRVAWFYGFLIVYSVYLVQSGAPYVGVNEAGVQELMFANERPPGHPATVAFSLLLLLPPLLAALGYFLLFFQVREATTRYRVVLVSGAFIVWFAYSLLASIGRAVAGATEQSFVERLVAQSLGLLAAGLVLWAYHPPRWVRKRWDVQGVDDEADARRRHTQPGQDQAAPTAAAASHVAV